MSDSSFILLVDDSPVTRDLLRTFLIDEGFKDFLEASHGQEAINFFLQKKQIACIIADCNMPVMDGKEMCEKILEITQGKAPPLIILTAEENPKVKADFKRFKLGAWVSKPLNVKTIGPLVSKVIRDSQKGPQN